MDVDAVTAEVAAAVGLAEGPAGVADVLRVIARHEPVAAREISRQSELPVPIVAAICNELRKRDVVDRARPVRLTPEGRASLTGQAEPAAGQAGITGRCPHCGGLGVVVPDAVAGLAGPLDRAALAEPRGEAGPGPDALHGRHQAAPGAGDARGGRAGRAADPAAR